MTRYQQPWLHDLEICVRGNVTVVSDRVGDLGDPGTGVLVDDRRVLTHAILLVGGSRPSWLASSSAGSTTRTRAVARTLGDAGADPTIEVHRDRELVEHGLIERITVISHADSTVSTTMQLSVSADGADVATVKSGGRGETLPMRGDERAIRWQDERHAVVLTCDEGVLDETCAGGATWSWNLTVEPGQSRTVVWTLAAHRRGAAGFGADSGWDRDPWSRVEVSAADARVAPVVHQSAADLRGLLLTDPDDPADLFAAAGTPWYLTLFGRDSLWAARMMLPFGSDVAAGTLRALARRQGRKDDPVTAEAPGKILHEVRRTAYHDPVTGMTLPPVYYGSVDSTPLWLRLLHDAWLWGLPTDRVVELRPALDGALAWMAAQAAAGDGLLSYLDVSGTGLANQGWKDSGDSMRRRDGTLAPAPIALLETQAYAVAAAQGAADLLESVWGEDASEWRDWATTVTALVRERFWVTTATSSYLAMAIDGEGRQVDGMGSNMGHALGTGMLSPAEARRTAHVLTTPDLLGSAGIRTLSRDNPAYNPIGYHTGSVWAHDNAIAALGLAREGFGAETATVLRALLGVGAAMGNRLPELCGGDLLGARPVPYPASCRPQAWAAASVGALVESTLGLQANAPKGLLRLAPLQPAPFGALTVRGLRVGGAEVSVRVDAEGDVVDVDASGLDIIVG